MNDPWAIIGIFLFGAASGALVSWIAFASRIREIKHVVHLIEEQSTAAANASDGKDMRDNGQGHPKSKSASATK
jgi:hypothetical protein